MGDIESSERPSGNAAMRQCGMRLIELAFAAGSVVTIGFLTPFALGTLTT